MFEKRPEISETLQWMLQSRQVGDEILVKTLIHEQYGEVQRFSIYLLHDTNPGRVQQFVEQVIYTGVEKAQEYDQDYPVKVWLFRLAVDLFQGFKGGRKSATILDTADSGQRSLVHEVRKLINSMPRVSRRVFLLKFSHRLSNQQIAFVLDLPISEVERRLGLVGDKWMDWLGEEAGTPASDYRFQALFSKLWPINELSAEDEEEMSARILAYQKDKERRKHRLIVLGELFLVVMAIAVVGGMGRFITDLTPEPTSEIVYQTQLINQVVLISPTPGPTVTTTPFPEHAILYRAEGGETLGEIADRTFINVAIIAALNNISPDQQLQAGQKIMIGMTESRILMPTPEGYLSIPSTPAPTNEPLTSDSSQQDILDRMMQSQDRWQTLWAEALVIQYGPQGYVGEPDLRRQQIWTIQPYYNYLLDGENGGEVEKVYSSIGGLINMLNLHSGEEISNDGPERIQFIPDLQQMLMSIDFKGNINGNFEFLKREPIAGRDTLVLDWYANPETFQGGAGEKEISRVHQGRYWVDSSLGLVLRQQKFNGDDLAQLFQEIIVTKIEIDVPIPNRLFGRKQPLQTYFARNHRGDPSTQAISVPRYVLSDQPVRRQHEHQSAPPKYPVEKSQLSFQWTSLERFNPQLGTRVDVFGDGYYLGNIEFGEPRGLFCTRSADGSLIAFFSSDDNLPDGRSPLGWVDLLSLSQVNLPLPEIIPYDFAFSPDNRQLAVYGCEKKGEQDCGIYLVDISSGVTTHLTSVERGNGLIWNQESNAIAIQGSFLRQGKWRVLVFDAESGNVIFDGPFDWEGFSVSPESPIHDWGVPFPPIRGGLDLCSRPPQGE